MSKQLLAFVNVLLLMAGLLAVFSPLYTAWIFGQSIEVNGQLTYEFFRASALVACILILPALFLSSRFFKPLLWVGTLVLAIQLFLVLFHWHLFKQPINSSTVFILLETNFSESSEFISVYFDSYIWTLIAILTLQVILAPILLIIGLRRIVPKQFSAHKWLPFAALVFVEALLVIYMRKTHSIDQTIIGLAAEGYEEYKLEANKYDELGLHKPLGNFQAFDRQPICDNETYVVIIGESTARSHLGVYGYYRNTSPELSKLKSELSIFTDVISPHTHTISSLSEVLTPGNAENESIKYNGSLIQLANAAGFETYWISNQRPVGVYENLITKMAKAADHSIFTNNVRNSVQTPYDGVLVDFLEKIVENKTGPKMIFVHLLGTHADYKFRYPIDYNIYHDTPRMVNVHSDKTDLIANQYDNAVQYNDWVVSQMFKVLKNKAPCSFGVYFSDHGEDVFENLEIACHTETRGTKPMYDIPFIFWGSEEFMKNRQPLTPLDRPYMLDDLYHSLADLVNIEHDFIDETRSLFSPHFENRKRIIYGDNIYDELFKSSIQDENENRFEAIQEFKLDHIKEFSAGQQTEHWLQRVNSVGKLLEFEGQFSGFEIDLAYENGILDVGDPNVPSIGLNLIELIGSLKNPESKRYWLDLKNLNIENVDDIIGELMALILELKLEPTQFIIESQNIELLAKINNKGFLTSFFIPQGMHTVPEENQSNMVRTLQARLKLNPACFLSSNYKDYPILHENFPDRTLLFWHSGGLGNYTSEQSEDILKNIESDPKVFVLLKGKKSAHDR